MYIKKVFSNRTIGLQKAIIQDSFSEQSCLHCKGTGIQSFVLPSKSFKNLKAKVSEITVENECESCDHGMIKNKIRIIKKNQISAII